MSIIVLDSTTKSLKVNLSGAVANTNPSFVVTFADTTATAFTEASSDGVLNGTSNVTVVAAPAIATRRVIKNLIIKNNDTAAVTVNLFLDNNGTSRNIAKVTLAVDDTWTLSGTFSSNGSLKQTLGTNNLDLTGTTSAQALTVSGATTLSSGTANGVLYLNGSKVATSGSALTFDGTNFTIGSGGSSGGFSFTQRVAASASPVNAFRITNGSDATFDFLLQSNLGTFGTGIGSLAFTQNGTEGMRLTSTGLGIGTSSPSRKLEVNGISRFTDGTSNVEITNGGGVGYIGPQTNHPLAFQTNNTERARITSGGYLGISTSSPQNYLDLGASSTGNGLTWSNYSNVFSEYSSGALILSSNYYGNIGSGGYKTATTATFGAAGIQVSGTSGSGTSGLIQFFVDPATSKTAGNAFTPTERVRITSGGDFRVKGAGTAGSTEAFQVSGSAPADAARIDSSGNLLVGATATSYGMKMRVNGGIASTGSVQFNIDGTSATNFEWVLRLGTGMQFYVNNATVIATLTSSGVWTNASDARYKENIRPVTYGIAEVMQLQPRAYNIIGSERQEIGFVAQEVEPFIPELVESSRNSVTEEERLTLSYGQMSAVLVKAIQEQQALITSLTARIAALEGTQP
jgi:Chaperone of endosialidase